MIVFMGFNQHNRNIMVPYLKYSGIYQGLWSVWGFHGDFLGSSGYTGEFFGDLIRHSWGFLAGNFHVEIRWDLGGHPSNWLWVHQGFDRDHKLRGAVSQQPCNTWQTPAGGRRPCYSGNAKKIRKAASCGCQRIGQWRFWVLFGRDFLASQSPTVQKSIQCARINPRK